MAIAVAAMMVVCAFAALTVDIGLLLLNRTQLVNLADAAALAGVQELPTGATIAVSVTRSYAAQNGKIGDTVAVAVFDSNEQRVASRLESIQRWFNPVAEAVVAGPAEATTIRVQAQRSVNLMFARVIGLQTGNVNAQAAARISPLGSATGIVPFGIEQQNFVFGQLYTLKNGSGQGASHNGNFGALALGGSGAAKYETNIKHGYSGKIKVGDWVATEPGNMSGPTCDGVEYRISRDPSATVHTAGPDSGRVVVVPIIESLQVNGRSEVLIVGFGAFFLEGVGGSGNKNYVLGRFMRRVTVGEPSGSAGNFGAYTARLIAY